jgi:L-2-hydroxyglutarate oxidase
VRYDFIIIGAGIVGASAAWQLQCRQPRARILLLEKEAGPARHQTGRNSGVVHAGVYYEPGSLKARFCREGNRATETFCRLRGIPFERIGKLLVATSPSQLEGMRSLFDRCRENGLQPRLLTAAELKTAEPAVVGAGAVLVKESAITDFPAIARAMLEAFREHGGAIRFGHQVTAISESDAEVTIHAGGEIYTTSRLIVCGGLMADRLARLQGLDIDFHIVPYRGEYYRLRRQAGRVVQHLIYPIPDPALPFLGVHLTPQVNGSITVGPNAVQGWKREGYGRLNFSLRDTADMLAFPGFWKVGSRHFRHGLTEARNSLFKAAYLSTVRRYCPRLNRQDLKPHPAGIRAQAVLPDGTMVHDFLLEKSDRSLHVCNAPSPAATSAIPIGSHICDLALGDARNKRP